MHASFVPRLLYSASHVFPRLMYSVSHVFPRLMYSRVSCIPVSHVFFAWFIPCTPRLMYSHVSCSSISCLFHVSSSDRVSTSGGAGRVSTFRLCLGSCLDFKPRLATKIRDSWRNRIYIERADIQYPVKLLSQTIQSIHLWDFRFTVWHLCLTSATWMTAPIRGLNLSFYTATPDSWSVTLFSFDYPVKPLPTLMMWLISPAA